MIHSPPPSPCRLALHLLFPSGSFTHLSWSTNVCLQPHSICMLKIPSWPKPQPSTLHGTSVVFRGHIHWWAQGTGQGPLIWWIWTIKRMSLHKLNCPRSSGDTSWLTTEPTAVLYPAGQRLRYISRTYFLLKPQGQLWTPLPSTGT